MLKKGVLWLVLFWLSPFAILGQSESLSAGILFYNVENLFDPADDPGKMDEEFMPGSDRRWTYRRKEEKLNQICRVLLFAGRWNPPVLVGLGEVENLDVLQDLIWNTGLNHLDYHILHYPSPDERGVDVALLYRNNRFNVLESHPVQVFMGEGARPTRDILFVCGVLDQKDTLYVMVNHWPSRYGGEVASIQKRMAASTVLRGLCDSVQSLHSQAKIVAMGDFNDEPGDRSLLALTYNRSVEAAPLVNLALRAEGPVPGTIKFRNNWSLFDQIIVSESLLTDTRGWHLYPNRMQIVAPDFLLEKDPDYPGVRPWRTYRGYKYVGGYSDHLPVMIHLRGP